ncbi:phosphonate transporter [Pseudoduganella armeniaca]|uniref:Phosphonate transporter n=1 Tax=Pseudoduganella armeniaca TaxID=2072590 RepID=A0A2R4C832_9BURK|nr:phosphonate transporter [Pseudoduganella armeniaca]AVR95766.1 phosphonate transporter [Pseudoduganella armeniaca]
MSALSFDAVDLAQRLGAASAEDLDAVEFGIIGFDADTVVRQYNRFESQAAGLSPTSVLGLPLFTTVAPCMNNFMVAQRFEDAAADGAALDETISYVLTLRMKPVKVLLRLLALPGAPMRYVLVQRRL